MTDNKSKYETKKNINFQAFRIVIIEDDEGLGKLIQVTLQREGFKTVLCETGEEAINKVQGDANEILLVDYKLPDMTGHELVKKLIKKHSATPNFFTLTGYGNEKVAAEMMRLGSHDYIVKEKRFLDVLSAVLKRVCEDVQNRNNLIETREQLREKLELLKETGEMASVGGWEVDLQTNKVFWTDTTKKIHEVAKDYLPKLEEAIDFFPGESKKQIQKAIEQAIQKGMEYELELQFITARGNHRWVHTIGSPKMKNGKCIRLNGTFQDITRRKEAEIELLTKNAILKRTEEIAHVGSWEWDVASDTVTWSDELFRIFKLNPEDGAVSYANHPKIYTPKSMKMLGNAVQECLKNGTPYKLDLEIIRGDGTKAFCTARGFAKKNNKGKIIQLFGSFQDITERKKAEEKLNAKNQQLSALNQQLASNEQQLKAANQQLEASEQQLRAGNQQLKALNQQLASNEQQLKAANQQLRANEQQLRAANQQLSANEKALIQSKETAECYLNVAAEIIVSLDQKGNITLMNESGHQLLGYENGKLIGKNWFTTCLPEKDKNEISNVFNQIIKGELETVENYQSDIQTKSGQIRTILWHNTFFENENGEITGSLSSGEDITERIKAEEALAASERKYRSIMDNSSSSIFIKDLNGKYLYINRKFEEMHDFSNDEIQSLTDEDLFDKELAKQFQKNDQEIIKTGKPANFEEKVPWKGEIKTVLSNKFPLRDENGDIYAVCGISADITAREKAAEALRASQENLKTTFELSPSIISKANLVTGYFIEASQAVTKILGYSVKEFTSQPFMKLIHPDDRQKSTNEKDLQIKGKEVTFFENRYLCKDGSYKWIAWYGTKADKNGIVRAIGSDITDRKKAEEEIEINEERFRKAQEAGHIGSWEYNLETGEFWGSDEGRRIYNLEMNQKEFPAEEVMNIVAEKDREKVNQAMIDLVNENKPYDIVFEITPKGTSDKKIIRSIAELQKDKKGNPQKVTGVLMDITELKRAEIELKNSEIKFRNIAENIPGLVLRYKLNNDGTDELLYLGKSVETLFEIPYEEAIKKVKLMWDRIHPDDLKDYVHSIKKSAAKLSFWNIEHRILMPDGRVKWIQSRGIPVKDKDGNVIWDTLQIDITKRKKVELKLIKAKEKAEQADMLKSAFLANMSHEIRTPMNGILGFTDLLQTPDLSGEQRQKFIDIIQKSGTRMLETVNALIDISKIETGQVEVNMGKVDVNNVLMLHHSFFKPEAKRKGLDLTVASQLDDKYSLIKTDRQKLDSIFTNLIKNAIKYTDKGFIKTGLERIDNYLRFYIKDSGIGVPENRQKAIFNRFEQADIKDTRAFQGSGLGLAITKAYVEMLGGTIWIESEEGKGSTFYFTLPLEKQVIETTKTKRKEEVLEKRQIKPNRKMNILIVEDEITSVSFLKVVLSAKNATLLFAENGQEAVEMVKNHPEIDTIIMDIKLPIMDGYEATRKIREFNKEVKIIAQTAYALEGDREKAIEAGCDDYISKPINKNLLLKKLDQGKE